MISVFTKLVIIIFVIVTFVMKINFIIIFVMKFFDNKNKFHKDLDHSEFEFIPDGNVDYVKQRNYAQFSR